jgi:hypothetical protein
MDQTRTEPRRPVTIIKKTTPTNTIQLNRLASVDMINSSTSSVLYQQVITTPVAPTKPIEQILAQPAQDLTISSSEFTNDEYLGNDIIIDEENDFDNTNNNNKQNDYGIRNIINTDSRVQSLPSKFN